MNLKDMMALTAGIGALMIASGARAEPVCAEHQKIVDQLTNRYGETRQSLGLATNGSVVEVFASDAGTWTILVTDADGRTCLAAAGEAWQEMAAVIEGKGA